MLQINVYEGRRYISKDSFLAPRAHMTERFVVFAEVFTKSRVSRGRYRLALKSAHASILRHGLRTLSRIDSPIENCQGNINDVRACLALDLLFPVDMLIVISNALLAGNRISFSGNRQWNHAFGVVAWLEKRVGVGGFVVGSWRGWCAWIGWIGNGLQLASERERIGVNRD